MTGAADTSGKKQDVYFCHDFCELGAISAEQVFGDIRDFLDRNLTDVVIIDLEDYVKPKDIKKALVDANLFDRAWIPKKGATPLPTLYDMVVPKNPKAEDNRRRLIVMSERHPEATPWMHGTYTLSEETPYTFQLDRRVQLRGEPGRDRQRLLHHEPLAASRRSARPVPRRGLLGTIADKLPPPAALHDIFKPPKDETAAAAATGG